MRRPLLALGAALAAAAAITLVLLAARHERGDPARCPEGLSAQAFRCCASGQHLSGGACVAPPTRCPLGFVPRSEGCVAEVRRIHFPGGKIELSSVDWEAEGVAAPGRVEVKPFDLDSVEVTVERWSACAANGVCPSLAPREPGVPVTGIHAEDAEKLCASSGGRLPTGDEWLFAAAGESARRYPWGQTGLVCRRAAFGLVAGPCASGGAGPELAGARPDGRSPEGVLDLAGNVAELAREPDGSVRARGGSFRSSVAGALKSWAAEPFAGPSDHVGFRCAYPPGPH